MDRDISFSSHSLSQFSKRLCLSIVDGVTKIRDIWSYSQEISRQKAYELTKDKEILRKRNDTTKYYLVDFSNPDVFGIVGQEGSSLPIKTTQGIFVVRGNECVTFKTSIEASIWDHLHKFKNSRKHHDYLAAEFEM